MLSSDQVIGSDPAVATDGDQGREEQAPPPQHMNPEVGELTEAEQSSVGLDAGKADAADVDAETNVCANALDEGDDDSEGNDSDDNSNYDSDSGSSGSEQGDEIDVGDDDDGDDDDDEEPSGTAEQMRTAHEVLPSELPVEKVKVALPPGAELTPVGSIKSLVGTMIVVQSDAVTTEPLDIGSVLWREDRTPLGEVFDVFGRVFEPSYIVRLENAEEAQEKKIVSGELIFSAPAVEEATKIVQVGKLRRIKGSDASWQYDEEPPAEKLDFSDDEQEQSHRALLQAQKAGMSVEEFTEKKMQAKKEKQQRRRKRKQQQQPPAHIQAPMPRAHRPHRQHRMQGVRMPMQMPMQMQMQMPMQMPSSMTGGSRQSAPLNSRSAMGQLHSQQRPRGPAQPQQMLMRPMIRSQQPHQPPIFHRHQAPPPFMQQQFQPQQMTPVQGHNNNNNNNNGGVRAFPQQQHQPQFPAQQPSSRDYANCFGQQQQQQLQQQAYTPGMQFNPFHSLQQRQQQQQQQQQQSFSARFNQNYNS